MKSHSPASPSLRWALAAVLISLIQPASAQPGFLDPSFISPFPSTVFTQVSLVLPQGDGRVLAVASSTAGPAFGPTTLFRLLPDGRPDFSYRTNTFGGGNIIGATFQADGRLLVAGSFTSVNGQPRTFLARLDSEGSLDPDFVPQLPNIGAGFRPGVNAVLTLADGKLLAGGTFYLSGVASNRNNLVRLHANGSVDLSYSNSPNSTVSRLEHQDDGRILVTGSFMNIGAQTNRYVSRLLADGTPDPSFTPGTGPDSTVFAAVPAADGKILLCGFFNRVNGVSRYRLARLNEDGSTDLSFDPAPANFVPGANSTAWTVLGQSDGKVIVGGDFGGFGPYRRRDLMRLLPNGSVDFGFGFDPVSGADSRVSVIARQADGSLLIAGMFYSVNNTPMPRLARVFTGETVAGPPRLVSPPATRTVRAGADVTFTAAVYSVESATMQWQFGGAVLPGATNYSFTNFNTQLAHAGDYSLVLSNSFGVTTGLVARLTVLPALTTPGSAVFDFYAGRGPDSTVYALALQSNGRILAGGAFSNVDGQTNRGLVRLESNGAIDPQFQSPQTGTITLNNIFVDAQDEFYAGGSFTRIHGAARTNFARFQSNGALDTSYLHHANNPVYALAQPASGHLYLGGGFTIVTSTGIPYARNYLARFTPDRELDHTKVLRLGPSQVGAGPPVRVLRPLPDGSLLVGGWFSTIEGITRPFLARISPDGSYDGNYPAAGAPNSPVHDAAPLLDGSGRVLVVGVFTAIGNTRANHIARLLADGSIDRTFNPGSGADNWIQAVLVQADGKIVVAGGFSQFNGVPRKCLARLYPDGSLDHGFAAESDAGADSEINTMIPDVDGSILIGGSFTTVSGISRSGVARIYGGHRAPAPPVITLSPSNLTARAGVDTGLVIGVISDAPPSFQWLLNGAPLSGQTNQTLTLRNIQTTNAGSYTVLITNPSGSATSAPGVITVIPPASNPGAVDITFYAGDGIDGTALSVSPMPDGTIYAGGQFFTVDGVRRPYFARLRNDGSLHPDPVPAPNSIVRTLLRQSDGSLILGGAFTAITNLPPADGGTNYTLLARLRANGTFDSNFERLPCCYSGEIRELAEDIQGRLFVGGSLFRIATERFLLRLEAQGRIDSTFTNRPTFPAGPVSAFTLLPDGDMVAAGVFSPIEPGGRTNLIRMNADRSVDDAFGYPWDLDPGWGPDGGVEHAVVQGNGALLVAGTFSRISGITRTGVARILPDGSPDPSFNLTMGSSPNIVALAQEPGGRIVIGGRFSAVNGIARNGLARLNADGSLDSTFDPGSATSGGNSLIFAIAGDGQGRFLVAGSFVLMDGLPRRGITRLLGDSPGPPSIATQPRSLTNSVGSSFVLAATVRWTPGTTMQWYHDGVPAPGGTNGVFLVSAAQRSDSGAYRLIASNSFGQATSAVAQVTIIDAVPVPGSVNATFVPTNRLTSGINDVAFQTDGVLVAGNSSYPPNALISGLVRLRENGTEDTGFAAQFPTNGYPTLRTITVQTDGAALIGGFMRGGSGKPNTPWMARVLPGGLLDPSFTIGAGFAPAQGADQPGPVRILVDRWNRVLFGGALTNYNERSLPGGLGRAFSDGALDNSFFPPTGNRIIMSLGLDEQDRLYLSQSGTAESARLQRLHSDGRVDSTFSVLIDNGRMVNAWVMQTDGRIIIGGSFRQVNGLSRAGLARLLPTGQVDPSYAPPLGGLNSTVYDLALQADGKLLVAGMFTNINGVAANNFGRLLPTGSPDLTFDTRYGANGPVRALDVTVDGRIVLAGSFSAVNRVRRNGVAVLHGGPFSEPVVNVDAGPFDANVLVGDPVTLAIEVSALPAPTFQWYFNGNVLPGATNRVLRIESARLTDTGFYLARVSNAVAAVWSSFAEVTVRPPSLESSAADPYFTPSLGPDAAIEAMAVDSDGRIVIGGRFTRVDGTPRRGLARLLANGRLDPSFDPGRGLVGTAANGGVATVNAIALASDGSVFAGGNFTNIAGRARQFLARLDGVGRLDDVYDAGLSGSGFSSWGIKALAVQADGNLVIGGQFEHRVSAGSSNLMRLDREGGLDASFNPGAATLNPVNALVVDPAGRIYVGGRFRTFFNVPPYALMRLLPDGSVDETYFPSHPRINPDFFDPCYPQPGGSLANEVALVLALASTADGGLLVGGFFEEFNNAPKRHLARLDSEGRVDLSFNPGPGPNYNVRQVVPLPSGQILIAGCFSTVDGLPRPGLARLHADGSLDTNFNVAVTATGLPSVRSIAAQSDGRVLIGGAFSMLDNRPAPNIARLSGEIVLFRHAIAAQEFSGAVATVEGRVYVLEFATELPAPAWTEVGRLPGDGTTKTLRGPRPSQAGFYRVRVE